MLPSFGVRLTASVMALVLVGCSGVSDPSELQLRDYSLTSINDSQLPVTLSDGSSVIAGVLRIETSNVVMQQTFAPESGNAGSVQIVQQENFTLAQVGSTFFLRSVGRLEPVTDTGVVEGATIIVRHHLPASVGGQVQVNTYLK